MSADLTIYCLEQVTDYFDFERLCHDLMTREGYSSIEPLGGSKDKGRDAIHINEADKTTIFAYSVREEWRVKLAEDAEKVRKYQHTCEQFIFISTAKFTAYQRDEAVAFIKDEFGWQLELFGIERLRILLDVKHPQIKQLHPGIFPPDFLAVQNRKGDSTERDHLFMSSVDRDGVFADWLTRKLTAEGYCVWSERFKLLGGETYPDDVDEAIKNRTFRFLGLYSQASLNNQEVMRQRSLAISMRSEDIQDFLIPLDVDGVNTDRLDHITRNLNFISFKDYWAVGLKQLLEKLESINCPKSLPNGKQIAAETFLGNDVLSDQKETLFSNCLQVQQLPKVIYCFKTQRAIPKEKLDNLKSEWSFRRISPDTFLSFHYPPTTLVSEYGIAERRENLWQETKIQIYGIHPYNLVSELIRKALIVKCHQKGLRYCPETKQLYFPSDLVNKGRLDLIRPDSGSKTYVLSNGKRKHPSGGEYLYALAPDFYVRQDLFNDFTALIRIRVRLSDTTGKAFTTKRTIDSRRKNLCKNWWNKHWLNRTLAVSQFLADDGKITIGESQDAQIVIDANPLCLNVPVGINEEALDRLNYERSESIRIHDSEDEYLDEYISDSEINDG